MSVPRAISTSIIEPSGMAIGPSGNCKPSVIACNDVIQLSLSSWYMFDVTLVIRGMNSYWNQKIEVEH